MAQVARASDQQKANSESFSQGRPIRASQIMGSTGVILLDRGKIRMG